MNNDNNYNNANNRYGGIIKSHTVNNISNMCDSIDKKLNIVLDLDNTIIYVKIIDKWDDILKIKYIELFKNKNLLGKFIIGKKTYVVFIRPYFSYFLNTIKMYYNLYIYTNSHSEYCSNIIKLLKKKYSDFDIKKIICRNNSYSWIKKLSSITNECDDLHFLSNENNYFEFIKNTIIIDDNIEIWKYDKQNVINVKSFNELNYKLIPADDTLLILTNRLFSIHNFFFNNNMDNNCDVKYLISKYKLYN